MRVCCRVGLHPICVWVRRHCSCHRSFHRSLASAVWHDSVHSIPTSTQIGLFHAHKAMQVSCLYKLYCTSCVNDWYAPAVIRLLYCCLEHIDWQNSCACTIQFMTYIHHTFMTRRPDSCMKVQACSAAALLRKESSWSCALHHMKLPNPRLLQTAKTPAIG